MKKTIYIFGIVLLFNSCSKPTESCFNYSPANSGIGDIVTFDAGCSSTNASSFIWNFGDGTADTTTISKTITHKFTSNGKYTVKLTAGRKDGVAFRKDKDMSKSITIQ